MVVSASATASVAAAWAKAGREQKIPTPNTDKKLKNFPSLEYIFSSMGPPVAALFFFLKVFRQARLEKAGMLCLLFLTNHDMANVIQS